MSSFSKYWDDLKKHEKRVKYWLPHLQEIASRLGSQRDIRYFTLCAIEMIDVFMLIREGILRRDQDSNAIRGVQFCECVPEDFTLIRDLVASEDIGFLGLLEDIALFQDDEFTLQYPTKLSIEEALALEDVAADWRGKRLNLKRRHHDFKATFPFDYMNLDFCAQYYEPSDLLKVNKTVERFLEWQKNDALDGSASVDEFVMAITCKLEGKLPVPAANRLSALVRENCAKSDIYDLSVRETRGWGGVAEWLKRDLNDFFLAAWPKDIASIAKALFWKTDIIDYVHYTRMGDHGNPYSMVCLMARFTRERSEPDYMPAALYALDRGKRKLIPERLSDSPERKSLRASLNEIVKVRNEQAKRFRREDLLPEPGA
jgi:hypothetical protein